MEAIEFQTTLGKESVIAIPDSVSGKVPRGNVRVIVLAEDRPFLTRDEIYDTRRDQAEGFIRHLMTNPIKVDKTTPFLTREEIHDRKI